MLMRTLRPQIRPFVHPLLKFKLPSPAQIVSTVFVWLQVWRIPVIILDCVLLHV
jgi:hypothetical protein